MYGRAHLLRLSVFLCPMGWTECFPLFTGGSNIIGVSIKMMDASPSLDEAQVLDAFTSAYNDRFQQLVNAGEETPMAMRPPPPPPPPLQQRPVMGGGCSSCSSPMPSAVVEIIKVHKGGRKAGGLGWWWLLIFVVLAVPIGLLVFSASSAFCKKKSPEKSQRSRLLGNSLSVESHMTGGGIGSGGGGPVYDITSPGDAVPSGPETSVVMYHATWCGHCKEMRPVFDKVAAQSAKNIKFSACENEVLQKSGKADSLQIKGYPTIIAFRGGSKVSEAVGNMAADKLTSFIKQL